MDCGFAGVGLYPYHSESLKRRRDHSRQQKGQSLEGRLITTACVVPCHAYIAVVRLCTMERCFYLSREGSWTQSAKTKTKTKLITLTQTIRAKRLKSEVWRAMSFGYGSSENATNEVGDVLERLLSRLAFLICVKANGEECGGKLCKRWAFHPW